MTFQKNLTQQFSLKFMKCFNSLFLDTNPTAHQRLKAAKLCFPQLLSGINIPMPYSYDKD